MEQYSETVAHTLKVLGNKLNRRAEASIPAELKRQVTEVQGRVLGFLYRNREREIFQKDVESEFSITRATASKMLSTMERAGLITRCGVAGDARLKRILLTERAEAHIRCIRRGMADFESGLTRGISDADKATLLRLLHQLERNIES